MGRPSGYVQPRSAHDRHQPGDQPGWPRTRNGERRRHYTVLGHCDRSPNRVAAPWCNRRDHRGSVSPGGRLAVAGSLDGTVRFWDVADPAHPSLLGQPVRLGGQSGLTALAVSPDGKVLATGDQQGDVDLFDIADAGHAVILGTDRPIRTSVVKLTFSPDGTSLTAVTATGQAVTWSVAPFRRSGDPLLITTSEISAVAGDGEQLAAGDIHGHIVLWSYTSRWQLGTAVPLFKGGVTSEVYSPYGSRLISGSADGRVIVWDLTLSSWQRVACDIAGRNLTAAEWQQFIGGALPYAPLCPTTTS